MQDSKRKVDTRTAIILTVLCISAIVLVVSLARQMRSAKMYVQIFASLAEADMWNDSGSPPSGVFLIKNYREHQGVFEDIHEMINEDIKLEYLAFPVPRKSILRWFGFGRMPPEYAFEGSDEVFECHVSPEDYTEAGVDKARIEKYREAMLKIGCKVLSRYDDDGSYVLEYYSRTFLHEGTKRGYFYMPTPPEEDEALTDNFDEYVPSYAFYYDIFQHIEDNWYIFHNER